MLALAEGVRPQLYNLKTVLEAFIQHRRQVVYRRILFELKKAEARAHILEGLIIALDHIDEVISIIRSSPNVDEARIRLMTRFGLSQEQAQAILDMRLQRLTGLEREKIEAEYVELLKLIEKLRAILASDLLLMNTIKDELRLLQEKYGDGRRTEIVEASGELVIEDLIAEEEVVVLVTHENYIKRTPLALYRAQRRGTKGRTGIATKDGDFVDRLFVASTHHFMLFFSNKGKVYALKVYKVPEGNPASKGRAIANIIPLEKEEKIAAVLSVKSFDPGRYLFMATKQGIVKKTRIEEFANVASRSTGLIALTFRADDELIAVQQTTGDNDVFLATRDGMAIRFPEAGVRPMGRSAGGVAGIGLDMDDVVVGMLAFRPDSIASVLTVTENGFGKRTELQEYRPQGRAGKGLINIKISNRTGKVVGILPIQDGDEMLMITTSGKLLRQRIDSDSVRLLGRISQGVMLQDISETGSVVAVAKIPESAASGPEEVADDTDVDLDEGE